MLSESPELMAGGRPGREIRSRCRPSRRGLPAARLTTGLRIGADAPQLVGCRRILSRVQRCAEPSGGLLLR
jgi:hypothetical protein